jgi:predicted RNase H-like HicB family nuclease
MNNINKIKSLMKEEEALANLKEATELYLEEFSLKENI